MIDKKNKLDLILEIFIFITTLIILFILLIQVTKDTPKTIKKEIVTNNDHYGIVYNLNNYLTKLNINDFNNLLSRYKDFRIIDNKTEEVKNNENLISKPEKTDQKNKIVHNPCPKPKKEYMDMKYLNVGQTISLPDKSYIPKNLVKLNNKSITIENLCLIEEARDAFEKMIDQAKNDGILIKASSAFRGFNTQSFLFSNSIKTNPRALISVSKPGHSEHQLGTTVDLTGPSVNYASASDKFKNTPEDLWLRENAYLYGFIQSYPIEKENTTGYRHEPWHYRYIGIDKAKQIKEQNITITEFLK